MTVHQVSYQTVGSNRDKARLWIEGAKISTAGFVPGSLYDRFVEGDDIVLRLSPAGSRKVSKKTRHGREIPVIDLTIADDAAGLEVGTRVRVLFTFGEVRISLHHEEKARVAREREFSANLAVGEVTEASMFTGGGISTHAIHTAISDCASGSRLAWVVDADLGYLQSAYANNYAITDETVALIGRAEEVETRFYRKVDILSFSMPCSGFSPAGKAKHGKNPEEHEGAAALFGTMNAIRASNPAVMISENVVGAQKSAAYVLLRAEIERLGYVIFERVMSASDTGSIEKRKRYWFVAISSGLAEGFDFSLIHDGAMAEPTRIRDILDTLVPETSWRDASYLKDKAERDAAAGKGFTRQVLDLDATNFGTIGRHYNKGRSTEPRLAREDGKERLLTPAEHARAKSVPEGLVAGVSSTTAHEILGQSVDWRQAYVAMACIMAHFTGQSGRAIARAA